MSILDRQNTISSAFKKIHKDISDSLKVYEDLSKIQDDIWKKNDLGNGNSVVIDDGNFFDKAGINFSSISGKSLPESSVGSKSNSNGLPFFATGVSVVFHPKSSNEFLSKKTLSLFELFSISSYLIIFESTVVGS